jgi:hypothetical protein
MATAKIIVARNSLQNRVDSPHRHSSYPTYLPSAHTGPAAPRTGHGSHRAGVADYVLIKRTVTSTCPRVGEGPDGPAHILGPR